MASLRQGGVLISSFLPTAGGQGSEQRLFPLTGRGAGFSQQAILCDYHNRSGQRNRSRVGESKWPPPGYAPPLRAAPPPNPSPPSGTTLSPTASGSGLRAGYAPPLRAAPPPNASPPSGTTLSPAWVPGCELWAVPASLPDLRSCPAFVSTCVLRSCFFTLSQFST